MARRLLIGLLLVLVGLALGLHALGAVADRDESSRSEVSWPPELIFNEDFDASTLDEETWSTCYWWAQDGCTIASNNELQWYLPEQVTIADGAAHLRAEKRSTTSPGGDRFEYASGMLTTGPRTSSSRSGFAFTYGRASVRMKVPGGEGLWSAFWLLAADRESRPEIDVVEIYGNAPNVARMNIHVEDRNGQDFDRGQDWHADRLADDWHTFAIDWRPGKLTWLIDGHPRWSLTGDSVPSEPMYPIVNLAVGGDPVGPPGVDVLPAELHIENLRVFRYPETVVQE